MIDSVRDLKFVNVPGGVQPHTILPLRSGNALYLWDVVYLAEAVNECRALAGAGDIKTTVTDDINAGVFSRLKTSLESLDVVEDSYRFSEIREGALTIPTKRLTQSITAIHPGDPLSMQAVDSYFTAVNSVKHLCPSYSATIDLPKEQYVTTYVDDSYTQRTYSNMGSIFYTEYFNQIKEYSSYTGRYSVSTTQVNATTRRAGSISITINVLEHAGIIGDVDVLLRFNVTRSNGASYGETGTTEETKTVCCWAPCRVSGNTVTVSYTAINAKVNAIKSKYPKRTSYIHTSWPNHTHPIKRLQISLAGVYGVVITRGDHTKY